MGLSASWIGVKGLERDDVLQRLGLQPAPGGATLDTARYAVGRRKDEWWIVVALFDHEFAEPKVLQPLSQAAEVVGVQVEEHVMASALYVYAQGRPVWCVHHNTQDEGPDHVGIEGDPPDNLADVVADLRRQQAEDPDDDEVDLLFEAPVIMAQRLCDYRIDDDGWDVDMTPLERARTQPSPAARRPGFLARLFGAR